MTQNKELTERCLKAGISSGRHSRAIGMASEGVSVDDAFNAAWRAEMEAQSHWVEKALKPWCDRHGITLKQGLTICFEDSPFNPVSRKDDLPTQGRIFEWGGQQNSFATRLMSQITEQEKLDAHREPIKPDQSGEVLLALKKVCNELNCRGELSEGGHDANTSLARAYAKATELIKSMEVRKPLVKP